MGKCCQNTDTELWRERPGDYYSDSMFVTNENSIGMNSGGHVIIMPLKKWHKSAKLLFGSLEKIGCKSVPKWILFKTKLARWLLDV